MDRRTRTPLPLFFSTLVVLLLATGSSACTGEVVDASAGAEVDSAFEGLVDAGPSDDINPLAATEAPRICADLPALPIYDDTPMFLYYGSYQRADDPGAINWPATLALLGNTPRAQFVLAVNPADPCTRFRPWIEAGGLLAFKMPRAGKFGERSLEAHLDAGDAADFVQARLAQGYAYVSIDELSFADGPARWQNGGDYAQAFAAMLQELAARGLDRRVILYINSYNNAGRLASFSSVLRACNDHCRVLASEVYMHISNVMNSAAGIVKPQSNPHCTFNLSCFDKLAREFDTAVSGINRRMITILRLDDAGYNDGRIDSLCKASTQLSTWGGLDYQYGRLHAGTFTRQQQGTGGYTPSRVGRHPNWGAIHQARCLGGLNNWWPARAGVLLSAP